MNCKSSSCKKNQRRASKELNFVYSERNTLALVFAYLARFRGWKSCLWPESKDWLILFIETPLGQLSWHIPTKEADKISWLPQVEMNPWDGHTTEEKYNRITTLMEQMK